MPQADYYERQEARRERYELRAERARQESDAAARQAEKMASIIPMGQPILVGHHSEGRDRRYRARIGQTMDKAISLDKKAAYYEEKAECVGQERHFFRMPRTPWNGLKRSWRKGKESMHG